MSYKRELEYLRDMLLNKEVNIVSYNKDYSKTKEPEYVTMDTVFEVEADKIVIQVDDQLFGIELVNRKMSEEYGAMEEEWVSDVTVVKNVNSVSIYKINEDYVASAGLLEYASEQNDNVLSADYISPIYESVIVGEKTKLPEIPEEVMNFILLLKEKAIEMGVGVTYYKHTNGTNDYGVTHSDIGGYSGLRDSAENIAGSEHRSLLVRAPIAEDQEEVFYEYKDLFVEIKRLESIIIKEDIEPSITMQIMKDLVREKKFGEEIYSKTERDMLILNDYETKQADLAELEKHIMDNNNEGALIIDNFKYNSTKINQILLPLNFIFKNDVSNELDQEKLMELRKILGNKENPLGVINDILKHSPEARVEKIYSMLTEESKVFVKQDDLGSAINRFLEGKGGDLEKNKLKRPKI